MSENMRLSPIVEEVEPYTYNPDITWENGHEYHPTRLVAQHGHLITGINLLAGNGVMEMGTSTFSLDEIPAVHAVVTTDSPVDESTNGQLYDAYIELNGTGRYQNRQSQRWQRPASPLSPGLNKILEIIHAPALQWAACVNEVMGDQGFFYIEGFDDNDTRKEAVQGMLEQGQYQIIDQNLTMNIIVDGEPQEVSLRLIPVSPKFRFDFIPGNDVDADGNKTQYQLGAKVDKEVKPMGWLIAQNQKHPDGKLVSHDITAHWAIMNKLRLGGFFDLTPTQQKLIMRGSFNLQTFNGGFTGTSATITRLEEDYGLDMLSASKYAASAHPEKPSMMAIIRRQLMDERHRLPNDLLIANKVADILAVINPADFEALRPVNGEGRSPSQDMQIDLKNMHMRPIHPFKFSRYKDQKRALINVARTYDLKTGGEGGESLLDETGALISPKLETARDVAIIMATTIVAIEQLLIEQVLTRALNNDPDNIGTLEKIGEAIQRPQFAQDLMRMGQTISEEQKLEAYALGRQRKSCEKIVEYIRKNLALDPLIRATLSLACMRESQITQGDDDQSTRKAIENIWRTAQVIHTFSGIPYEGLGINSGLQVIINQRYPSLELELAPLKPERIAKSAIHYKERPRGLSTPGATSAHSE